ncbi:MAG: EscE/YscE/SsaE family type III secretion system needle protein co-chaperone [Methylacidiphilaceae bacterium]|nr:EscE/YscE/SsaE family type III secretion system needle protein co-chaperone [Candidatus Methylacidiphilaceae bacterium]
MQTGLDLETLLHRDVDGSFRQRLVLLLESYEEAVRQQMQGGLPQARYQTMELLAQALAAAKTIALGACTGADGTPP